MPAGAQARRATIYAGESRRSWSDASVFERANNEHRLPTARPVETRLRRAVSEKGVLQIRLRA